MKKIALVLLALLWAAGTVSAQTRQKEKPRNRDKQGAIMSDTPNTIAPVNAADSNRKNNTPSRNNPANPPRNTINNNRPDQNSLDNEPLNRNSSGQNERNTDMHRNRSDINMNTNDILGSPGTPPTQPQSK